MFDTGKYQHECERLTLNETAFAEAISTVQQSKSRSTKPVRTAMLVAALVATLGVTAMAQEPIREQFSQFMVILVAKNTNSDYSDNGYFKDAVYTPAMSYEEKEGHKLFTVDGAVTDVTEAMEQYGFYTCEWDGASLHLTVDGLVTLTRLSKNGDISEEITLDLLNDGAIVYQPLEGAEADELENMTEVDLTTEDEFELSGYYSTTGASDR